MILDGMSNSLSYLHCTLLPPPELYPGYSLLSPKSVLVEPFVKLVTVGALFVSSSTKFGAWVRLPVRL